MKIFLDIDDTLADFKGYCISRGVPAWTNTFYTNPQSTWTTEETQIDKLVYELMDGPDFWSNLPVKDGAFDLLDKAEHLSNWRVKLLTAVPRICHNPEFVAKQKREWALNKLDYHYDDVICCDREDKKNYAKSSDHILIDDAIQNCVEWNLAGGTAIHYWSAPQAIKELEDFCNDTYG